MPDDATEGVTKHSSRLQPSINLHAPDQFTAFLCSAALVPMYNSEGMKVQVSPVQSIKPQASLASTQVLNQGPSGPQSRYSNHYILLLHTNVQMVLEIRAEPLNSFVVAWYSWNVNLVESGLTMD